MLRLNCEIEIGTFKFNFVTDVEISSAWKNLTDTGRLIFPKKIEKGGQSIFIGSDPAFKKGDKVTIKLGYYPNLETVFEGFIKDVEPTSPVVIHLEDYAFLLKQETKTLSYKSVDLETLLGDIVPAGVTVNTVAAELGSFRITNATPAQVLAELKKVYYLDSFFHGSTLYVGRQYITELATEHNILFENNIIEHNLVYKYAEDVKIKLKAISMLPDNTKIEYETGDSGGETRTAYFYDLTETELKAAAEREIPKLRYTGYRGDFLTFGSPRIKHGDIINLKALKFPEREAGKYFVDGVEPVFGQNGYKQRVLLGRQAE